jgi:hypothetical protein
MDLGSAVGYKPQSAGLSPSLSSCLTLPFCTPGAVSLSFSFSLSPLLPPSFYLEPTANFSSLDAPQSPPPRFRLTFPPLCEIAERNASPPQLHSQPSSPSYSTFLFHRYGRSPRELFPPISTPHIGHCHQQSLIPDRIRPFRGPTQSLRHSSSCSFRYVRSPPEMYPPFTSTPDPLFLPAPQLTGPISLRMPLDHLSFVCMFDVSFET